MVKRTSYEVPHYAVLGLSFTYTRMLLHMSPIANLILEFG